MKKLNYSYQQTMCNQTFLMMCARKAEKFVLRHNWYCDKAEVVLFMSNLSQECDKLAKLLASPDNYLLKPVLPITVPKSKRYIKKKNSKSKKGIDCEYKNRLLTDISFKDQVVWTALLVAIGNIFDYELGDPEKKADYKKNYIKIYGNRLALSWKYTKKKVKKPVLPPGNKQVYRDYYEDYYNFISEPEEVFNSLCDNKDLKGRICYFATDIKSFYPSIKRDVLLKMIKARLGEYDNTQEFYALFKQLLNFNTQNFKNTDWLTPRKGIPQGLISSGLLANIYLQKFDRKITKIKDLQFYARYVDDIRIICIKSNSNESSKYVKEHFLYCKTVDDLKSLGLKINVDKSSVIEEMCPASKLTQGRVAERMRDIRKRSYLPLIPEDARDLIKDLQVLFATEIPFPSITRTKSGLIDNEKSEHVIAGPGVRSDSRKRFCANNWINVWRDQNDQKIKWGADLAPIFGRELINQWGEDQSQTRLLNLGMIIANVKDSVPLVRKGLKELLDKKQNEWYVYNIANLMDFYCYMPRYYNVELKRKIRGCIFSVLQEQYDNIIPILPNCRDCTYILNKIENLFVFSRFNNISKHKVFISKFEAKYLELKKGNAFLLDIFSATNIVNLTINQVYPILQGLGGEINKVVEFILLQYQQDDDLVQWEMLYRAVRFVPELKTYYKCQIKRIVSIKSFVSMNDSLFEAIKRDEYSTNSALLKLAYALLKYIERRGKEDGVFRKEVLDGCFNPYNLTVKEQNDELIINDVNRAKKSVVGYKPLLWEVKEKLIQDNIYWAYPLGLILLFAITNNEKYSLGLSENEKLTLVFSPEKLYLKQGKHHYEILDWVSSLCQRPGTLYLWNQSVSITETEIKKVQGWINEEKRFSGVNEIQISRIPIRDWSKIGMRSKIRVAICQQEHPYVLDDKPKEIKSKILNIEERYEMKLKIRRLLKIWQEYDRLEDCDLANGNNSKKESYTDILIFPESIIPQESIPDLMKVARERNVIIVGGLWYKERKDEFNKNIGFSNDLLWIIPEPRVLNEDDDRKFIHLLQPKLFPTSDEVKYFKVVNPKTKVIYQIDLGQINSNIGRRVTGVICYDFTSLKVKAKLQKNTDLVVVPSFNKDINTFDNLADSSNYEMFVHIVVGNSGCYGGSSMRAPYHEIWDKRIFDIHGKELNNVVIREIDLAGLYNKVKKVKSPPADFV